MENNNLLNKYFKISEPSKHELSNPKREKFTYKFTYKYIRQFKNWKICEETELLSKETINYISLLNHTQESVSVKSNISLAAVPRENFPNNNIIFYPNIYGFVLPYNQNYFNYNKNNIYQYNSYLYMNQYMNQNNNPTKDSKINLEFSDNNNESKLNMNFSQIDYCPNSKEANIFLQKENEKKEGIINKDEDKNVQEIINKNTAEKKIKSQKEINKEIWYDLVKYKDYISEKDKSSNFQWNTVIKLYKDGNPIESIIEAFLIDSYEFIDNNEHINVAKNYIKEIIEYFCELSIKEKNLICEKIKYLIKYINEFSNDVFEIYDIYSYVIYVLIKNQFMRRNYLKEIFNENVSERSKIKSFSVILKKIYFNCEPNKQKKLKKDIIHFRFVKLYSDLFDWILNK